MTLQARSYWRFSFYLNCGQTLAYSSFHTYNWQTATYPSIQVLRMPAQLNVVAGLRADVGAVLTGGAAKEASGNFATPTPTNRASIEWQRSDDNGASWQAIARSFQDEADPHPLDSGNDWRYWGVHHGFVAAPSDHAALIRLYACYTPPDAPAPPCVTSPNTRLNVLQQSALPSIVDAPRSVLVKTGQTASFAATTQGAPTPTMRWQTRPANATGAWTDVSTGTGANTGNYTTPVLTTGDNGTQYRVVASNAMGSAESAGVTVSVSDLDVAPTITTQPASLSIAAGGDAAFAIAARGTEALSYQWRFNGAPISGANSPVLRLPAVLVAQAGSYTVTVTNAAGTATSSPATLTVGAAAPGPAAPTIVTQPVSVLINAGNTATFAVGVSGSSPIAYQWTREGQPIPGATAASYSMAQAVIGDAGTYRVQVSNGVGPAVFSDNVVLTVNASQLATPVVLTTHPSPQVQAPGASVTFAVAATGSGPIGYQWLKNGIPIAGATGAVLTLSNITGSDAASYAVTVSNSLNTVTSNAADLVVLGAPAITTQPAAASAVEGSTATFNVAASGSLLHYQWTRNGVAIAGATATGYTTPTLVSADGGAVYAVVVYNGAGVAFSSPAVLTVTAPAGFPANAVLLGASDNTNGMELWLSDGTANGTVLLKDINPGPGSSTPQRFTRFGPHMYFVADDGVSGRELWRTDGTSAGTVMVADLAAGAQSSFPNHLTVCNGALFFGADATAGQGLFKTDGTSAGTVRIANASVPTGNGRAVCLNNVLYFAGWTAATGVELWRSDGSVGGTVLLKDIEPGSGDSSPAELTTFLGQVYFATADGLWKTDGTAAGTVPIVTGLFAAPSWLAVNGATLYFSAMNASGSEPWKSDGSPAGTSILVNLNLNASSYPYKFTTSGAITYFGAEQSTGSQQLFRTDGTAGGTTAVHAISPGQVAAYGDSILDVNGTLYFLANDSRFGTELWKTDGTDLGTVMVRDIQVGAGGSRPTGFFQIAGVLYFSADGGSGSELWRSDGTLAGTVQVKDLCPGPCSSDPQPR